MIHRFHTGPNWVRALALLAAVLLAHASEAGGEPSSIVLNLVAVEHEGPICTDSPIDTLSCEDLHSRAGDEERIVWVVASDPSGMPVQIAGVQFGIEHDVPGLSFDHCGGLVIPQAGWPASGTGIAVACSQICELRPTTSQRLGYFRVPEGARGRIRLVPDPRTGTASTVDCGFRETELCEGSLGSIDLSEDDDADCGDDRRPVAPTGITVTQGACPIWIYWEHSGLDIDGFVLSANGIVFETVGPDVRRFLHRPRAAASHTYRVAAYRGCSSVAWSETSATAPSPGIVPPSDVSATDGHCQVAVTWRHPGGADGFAVRRDGNRVARLGPSARSFLDEAFENGVVHVYDVIALGECSDSAPSAGDEGHGFPWDGPRAMYLLRASDDGCGYVDLSWEIGAPPHEDIRVFRDGELIVRLPPEVRSYRDENVPPGPLEYEIVSADHCGPRNATAVGSSAAVPGAPRLEGLALSCGGILLAWTGIGRSRELHRDPPFETPPLRIEGYSFTDSTTLGGETYRYRVAGVTGCGEGPPSNVVEVRAQERPLRDAPVLIDPVGACTTDPVVFDWEPVANAVAYRLMIASSPYGPAPAVLDAEPGASVRHLSRDERYWRVGALASCGPGAWSDWTWFRLPGDPLPVPRAFRAQPLGGGWWRFSWQAAERVSTYRVTVSSACPPAGRTLVTEDVTGTSVALAVPQIERSSVRAFVSSLGCAGEVSSRSICPSPPPIASLLAEPFRVSEVDGSFRLTWRPEPGPGIDAFHVDRESPDAGRVRVSHAVAPVDEGGYMLVDSEAAPDLVHTYVLVVVHPDGSESDVARTPAASTPSTPAIAARPNPFNPRVEIQMHVPAPALVELEILDAAGRLVRALQRAELGAGVHRAVWDGTDGAGRRVGSGTYFACMRIGGSTAVTRITLLR